MYLQQSLQFKSVVVRHESLESIISHQFIEVGILGKEVATVRNHNLAFVAHHVEVDNDHHNQLVHNQLDQEEELAVEEDQQCYSPGHRVQVQVHRKDRKLRKEDILLDRNHSDHILLKVRSQSTEPVADHWAEMWELSSGMDWVDLVVDTTMAVVILEEEVEEVQQFEVDLDRNQVGWGMIGIGYNRRILVQEEDWLFVHKNRNHHLVHSQWIVNNQEIGHGTLGCSLQEDNQDYRHLEPAEVAAVASLSIDEVVVVVLVVPED